MTKYQTQIMKGVAILLMLFLHLFNQLHNVEECTNFLYVDGLPLVFILCRAANPVSFFLILGGYGLYKVNEKGDKHRWSRVLKLFIHYWIILLVFVTVGHFVFPERYPGSLSKIIANVTAFHTTYNGEMWFLFPYVVLSLMAPLIFRLMKPFKSIWIVLTTLFINICTSYCISRYGEKYLYNNLWIYNPLLVFHLLFAFSLGVVAARDKFFERAKRVVANLLYINVLRWGGDYACFY